MHALKTALMMAALATAASCASLSREAEPDIYVMRHLQAGTGTDPGLTTEGARQAELLAGWFRRRTAPRVIYVSTYRRSRETAAPLAAKLKIEPKTYDPSNTDGLVTSLRAERGPVLVVGHSNTVPDIVEGLGAARPAPIEHHQHGDIWRVRGGSAEALKLEP